MIRETLKLSQARLCSPTVEQYASLAAFGAPPEYLENVKREYEKRRDFIVKALDSIPGVKCSRPNGAFYLIARLPVEDAENFSIFMLRDFDYNGETVMLAPAEGFYESKDLGRDQVRIAYVLNTDDLKKACECLKKGLEVYQVLQSARGNLKRQLGEKVLDIPSKSDISSAIKYREKIFNAIPDPKRTEPYKLRGKKV